MKKPKIVLAFSGGLDTTFCALWLQKELGAEVVTATVDTGGFSAEELAVIAARSKSLGAVKHYALDGRAEVFARFAVPLIQGNILRGRVYPLSVAAERVLQAEMVARVAKEINADGVCHGSTGAGNDQVRFDAVFQVLLPGVKVHTPIRDLGLSRQQETDYLAKEGVTVPAKTTAYSINAGLWGTTVGGGATHDPWAEIPDSVFPSASAKP
ncbi:MAG: argininosuccinate synthase, partial [Elusimicrobia bacterium]|nr:argininosuccinate synthase [Elusimicrobiota bacterium]